MRLFFKTPVSFFLLMCLALSAGLVVAQRDANGEAPIIALSNNNIYAVSADDGEARLLVERDAAQNARLLEAIVSPVLILSPVSPDQTAFAYIAPLYEVLDPALADNIQQIAPIRPTDITLVDIASGEQTPITNQAETFVESAADGHVSIFSHLTWSENGRFLYFLSTTLSLRNRAPQLQIQFYDREAGEYQTLMRLPSQTGLMGLYGMTNGLAVLTKKENNMASNLFELTLYDMRGNRLNMAELELPEWVGPTNGTMLTMNPVLVRDDYDYGYYSESPDGLQTSLISPDTGTTFPLNQLPYPAFFSHANRESSLRVVLIDAAGTGDTLWVVTQGREIMPSMSLKGVVFQSELALSPNGDAVAFLKPGDTSPYVEPAPIMVMDASGTRELDFEANQILWGAIDYTFSGIDSEE